MVKQDDRTLEQMETHPYLVGGRDRFLSGWGKALDGSWAFWACTLDDVHEVEKWVENRGDITHRTVRITVPYKRGESHVRVYVVGPDHPALAAKRRREELAAQCRR